MHGPRLKAHVCEESRYFTEDYPSDSGSGLFQKRMLSKAVDRNADRKTWIWLLKGIDKSNLKNLELLVDCGI